MDSTQDRGDDSAATGGERSAESTHVEGSLPTVFVADMDRAVAFYTEVLGLTLAFRAGDHWASIDAGAGTQIGLHPGRTSATAPDDAISIGLNVTNPIETVIAELSARGVEFGEVSSDGMLKIAHFADPDGNPLYLCEQPRWNHS